MPFRAPFFSVVIPAYNRAHFLPETIDHILKQTCRDFELIIVDDGSTDDTARLLQSKYGKHKQVRYAYQENKERGAARNHGLRLSKGRYVVFFDSDDIMHANHLAVLKEVIEKHSEANFIASKFRLCRNGKYAPGPLHWLRAGWYDMIFFLRGNPLACHFCLKKNNPRLRPFPEAWEFAIMEDWMFLLQNLQDDRIYIADQVTITVNDHDARSMREDDRLIVERKQAATAWLLENLTLTPRQVRMLKGHTYYFCAAHSYAGGMRSSGFRYLLKSIGQTGLSWHKISLFVKLLLGYPLVQRIKGGLT